MWTAELQFIGDFNNLMKLLQTMFAKKGFSQVTLYIKCTLRKPFFDISILQINSYTLFIN